ncbi:MAG: hypothetical protein A3G24_25230 [Betaproteobacteria bacterium RIFCSPLOWO2_12_FULL_62_13]|nr:MAG: hypothetical protein A3G24_25230 [Betaproteobacteria bacterium RIFCSPLOWO2_12_FULL_62_13]
MLSRVLVVASVTMSVFASVAGAQPPAPGYPTRPIRFIVPFPPGGGTDIVARLIGQRLSERLGQQVVIDNRGGANAIIGTELGAKAPPDGYTILMSLQASLAVNPSLYRNLPYDSLRDFAPVIQLTSIPLLLAAHPSLPANSVKELVQLARAKPGQITFASSGTGGSSHLAMELFKIMAKVDMVHVPYKGGGPAINDLLGGQVQTYSGTAISVVPYVKAGRLKALGVTTARRLPVLPDVPAVGETIVGYESVVWQGVVVPKATPLAIVNRLNREIAGTLQLAEVKERLTGTGATVMGGTPAEFGALINSEIAKYAKLIKETGVRPD